MKKMIAMLLAAALLFSCGAFAAGVKANLGRSVREDYQDGISCGAVCGDTLYLMGYQNLYSWKIGEADLTPMQYQMELLGENRYSDMRNIFSSGDTLYGLMTTSYSGPDSYALEECRIVELIPGDGKVEFGSSVTVDITELTVDYGGGPQMVQVNSICAQGDYACMQVYDMNGNASVYCLDITTGTGFYAEAENAEMVTPYADGCFLVGSYDYGNGEMRLQSFDPESESLTECGSIAMEDYFSGLTYSQESGRLFFLRNGYVHAVTDLDFENTQPVAELSTQYSGGPGGLLLPGDVYVYCDYETVSVRSTQPEDMPETQIVVSDFTYAESVMDAYYAFGNSHGDVAVVISRDYTQDSEIIEAMMNRDSTVDVYVMNVNQQAYNALFERGYMLDLSGNETIRTAVEGMYPGIQEAVTRDGEIVAVPVQTYGWIMGVNPDALEAMGLDYDEIPGNWPDFLDFLVELPDMLPEDESVRIFDSYMIQSDVKYNLRNSVMEEYQMWLNDVGLERGYDTPELRAMLEKVMNMDYSIFGLPEDYEEDGEGGIVWIYDDSSYTLFNTGVGCTIGNFYAGQLPLLLSVSPEYAPHLPMDLSVAFVNPFSENPELATEFIAEMFSHVPTAIRYNFSDELSEPIRSSYYEENMKNMKESIAEMEKQLETAEAVDVPLLEESIASMKQALEENDKYWWEVSPESIEWFRSRDDHIAVQRFNYLYADGGGEIWEMTSQFMKGMIDLDTYIKGIDRKATMMVMEGN